MILEKWGWNDFYKDLNKSYAGQELIPGRIIKESRQIYQVITESGLYTSRVSGHYMYIAINKADYPTIGDWVLLRKAEDQAVIEKLMPRKSAFSRKKAGNETEEQIIAANADFIFLVFGLDGGRNFSRGALERFLTRSWDSGATPVILLNKADLCKNKESILIETENIASGADIHVTSAISGEGLTELKKYLKPGITVVFTGFSGVGKSALINRLAGRELMKTGEQRENDLRGRHTTTHKSLVQLNSGAILIDSPGIKELQLWGDEESLDNAFDDIATFAVNCRFSDCSHKGEPGCAVQKALINGELDLQRYENYLKMQKELRFLEAKQNARKAQEERAKWKKITKIQKNFKNMLMKDD